MEKQSLNKGYPEKILSSNPRIYLSSKDNGEYVIEFNESLRSYEVAHRNLDSNSYIIGNYSWSGVLRIFLTMMDVTFRDSYRKFFDASL